MEEILAQQRLCLYRIRETYRMSTFNSKPLSVLNCEECLSLRHDMALCPSQEHSASMKGAHVMLL